MRKGQNLLSIASNGLSEGDVAVRAKAAYEAAKQEYERMEALVADRIVSAKEFEQAKLNYANAKAAYEAVANARRRGQKVGLLRLMTIWPFADKAIERNIGARGLRAVMEGLLTQIMYDIPSDPTIVKAVITKDCVEGRGTPELTRDPEKVSYSVKLNTGKGEKAAKDGSAPKSAS